MDIVKRIKQKCAEKGTTMGTLEKELGFANGSIRRWDERVPGADRVLILANRLEISVDWLLTGKESGNLTPEEQQLIDYYRKADDRGKRSILRTAESESTELESSASKLGYCLLYTSPSPRDRSVSRMPSSA